ncbi:D-alanine--(R)-lactate ligase [Rathayibacter rathayi]|uniref:D-alanine--D-alanine ligase n=1 Tax=Rathayibacter rathayi TaxID=33887 RepID=A0ABD6W626_RATRA|nr:D-alanine--(R)-lactate ligase [Rathayibacter rathayi]AZZ47788.1 D-alanine--(R)-lactate ligase [Rathayibacter rathayi]MWV75040.1 D-alanine--(R)-lactate ligase [Rathayibacter rathayi NCPPB 2980 = VKM Ac-1601]PPF11496.1 D-alanine--(R)-lactate ligase [Rathayibacter rathayi]PPF20937.1 D-alanine--(R)-lactate ligase [Rathayibacter rathayi]PPF47704.1 D-alanine--(R)-lactate ligase [Rathayibacter rathayi]
MSKTTIAVLFGGCSEEHDVSVKSAIEIAGALDPERYDALWIGITRRGEWRLCEGPRPDWESQHGRAAVISPDRGTHGLLVEDEGTFRRVGVDVVLPVLHGTGGEDGSIQGLLELSGLPYVGCDIQGSVVCMDKSLAYTVAAQAGIPVPAFTVVHPGERVDVDTLSFPVFVKPARSGSSFGVTKVESAQRLDEAITLARRYDQKVLIEEQVLGSEVGCAVLGDGDDLVVGEVDQIRLEHGLFRIHQEAEPEKGSLNSSITVPAGLPEAQRTEIQERAKALYRALGCRGLARVDLFLLEDGRVVLNEVNTLPGFTSYSRYPRMMAAAGLSVSDLIDRSVQLAMTR